MKTADPLRMAVAAGLSLVCATCSKFHQAMERGLDKCLAVDGCGSPIVGDTFHEYDGPITDFLRFCFVCGQDSKKAIAVRGHNRKIGVCLEHLDYVVSMAPKTPRRLPMAPRIILGEGADRSAELLQPVRQNTLAQALSEMEKGEFKPDK